MRFQDKVVMVTGGAQGIGEGIVRRFAMEGATVVIADIQPERAKAVVEEMKSKGDQAFSLEMDITRYAEVNRGVAALLERFGQIDILINNVGWDMPGDFMKQPEEFWDRILFLNLKGPILVTRVVLLDMIEKRFGRIVNISSIAGRKGSPHQVVYSGAKGGVISLTKALARAYAEYNITVNCVAPGPTETPAMKEALAENPHLRDYFLQSRPIKRFASPDDIAGAVLFLASDEAAYITGQTLNVDGGGDMC